MWPLAHAASARPRWCSELEGLQDVAAAAKALPPGVMKTLVLVGHDHSGDLLCVHHCGSGVRVCLCLLLLCIIPLASCVRHARACRGSAACSASCASTWATASIFHPWRAEPQTLRSCARLTGTLPTRCAPCCYACPGSAPFCASVGDDPSCFPLWRCSDPGGAAFPAQCERHNICYQPFCSGGPSCVKVNGEGVRWTTAGGRGSVHAQLTHLLFS